MLDTVKLCWKLRVWSRDSLSLPGLGWKYFNSLRTEEDEPIYTYNDKYLRWFVRQSIKGERVGSFIQCYKSKNCDDVLKIISEDLNVEVNFYDIIEVYLKYKNKHLENFEKEYENKFDDYRKEDVHEREKSINEKMSKLAIHQLTKQTKLDEFLWGFDAVSLYPSAMWNHKSKNPEIETGYAYTKKMNDEIVEKFDNRTFTQGSTILKTKNYNPKNLIVRTYPS